MNSLYKCTYCSIYTNGVGYCPFPALDRDTTGGVVTGKAWLAQQARLCTRQGACVHDKGCVCVRAYLGRPVVTGFFRCSVAIENFLS